MVVPRLLASPYPTRAVVGFPGKLRAIEESLSSSFSGDDAPFSVFEVSREVLKEVAGFDMHRGLVASADRLLESEELSVEALLDQLEATEDTEGTEGTEGASGVIAVLEGVGDHENIGSIFRNAAGLGVDAVLFGAATADPLSVSYTHLTLPTICSV